MYNSQEELDDLVWDKNDDDYDDALKELRLKTTCRLVEELAARKFSKSASLVSPLIVGGFNLLYRIRLEGASPDVLVRVPIPSLVQFPEEKTRQEAATAVYVATNTSIPVPRQYFCDQDDTLGPYIILEFIDNQGSMSARLTIPNEDLSVTHVLNPDTPESELENVWTKAARCLLELSRLDFPRIGSLVETRPGTIEVAGRPTTHNMTDMIRLANIPSVVLPSPGTTYETADQWYAALAEMHIAQLIFQHNDLVVSEDDCRNKYVARQIFRRLARQGQLATFGFAEDSWSFQSSEILPSTLLPGPSSSTSFKLWGDDFRAGNILMRDSENIAALIDWEYAYAGPTQFILDPPWWLLLDLAETWDEGVDDWIDTYETRLKTWLSAMQRAEEESGAPSALPAALSKYMQESWQTGRFWLSYGAKKSWVFDMAYWRFLDERFFGKRGDEVTKNDLWKTRIHLLTKEEREAMEPFVKWKMETSEERKIVDWEPADAQQRLANLLFD